MSVIGGLVRDPEVNEPMRTRRDSKIGPYCGEAVRRWIEASGMTQEGIARLLDQRGFRRSKGLPYSKSFIANVAANRQTTPTEFVDHLAAALNLPEGWQFQLPANQEADEGLPSRLVGNPLVRTREVPYLESVTKERGLRDMLQNPAAWSSRKIVVPEFVASSDLLAVPIEGAGYFKVGWRTGDVLLLLPNELPRFGPVYAVTLKHNGEGAYMRAVEGEDGQMLLRSIDGAVFGLEEAWVDALVVCHLPQYKPGKNTGFFSDSGLEYPQW